MKKYTLGDVSNWLPMMEKNDIDINSIGYSCYS